MLGIGALAALGLLLCRSPAALASAAPSKHASTASASRWWRLDCRPPRTGETEPAPACVFHVLLRGPIDRSRLFLIQRAIQRGDEATRALGRDATLRVDVDSRGGEIFAGMEIGRLLRRERARFAVGAGASCQSACVFALMGAVETSVGDGARIGIHRPSLEAGRDHLLESMFASLAAYVDEMHVSRAILDDMFNTPSSSMRWLSGADLARYGITVERETTSRRP